VSAVKESFQKKKTNCRHGLNRKQEIEARRIREKLEESDKQIMAEYHKMWEEWNKKPYTSFAEYVKKHSLTYYSAYIRACQNSDAHSVYRKIVLYNE